MDDIRRMLDRLPELSDDELGALEDSIIQEFGVVEQQEISSDTVAEMTFLADSVESVRGELGKRDQERSSLAAQAAEAAARVTAEPSLDEAQTDESASSEGSTEPPEEFSAVEAQSTETVVEEAAEASAAEPAAAEAAIIEPPAAEAAVAEVPETEVPGTEAAAAEAPEASAAVQEPVAAAGMIPVIDEEELLEGEEPMEVPVDEVPAEGAPLAPEEEAIVEEAIGEAVDQALTDLVDEAPAPVEGEAVPLEEEEDEEGDVVFAAESAEAAVTDAVPTDGAVPTESVEAPMGNTTAGPTTFSAPADRLPSVRETVESAPITLIAGGDIPGITAGSLLNGAKGLSEAMQLRLHTLRRASGGRGDQVVVASLIAQFPEERTLRGNELDSNSDKIKSITNPHTIVASGGWCAPLPVNYDIFDIGGSTDTPVKDSLPTFTADRGGVRYIVPPILDDYVGAVGIWTNADDIAAAPPATTPRKACLTVACAAEQEVYLDAVTMCLCFGNLQTRAFPELIDRHNQLALVEAARFSEIYILNKIKAASTAVALPAVLGTARDVLISVERAAVAYRHQHRLDPALPLRFIAPQWLHAMIRSDLTAQLPGDGMDTTFNLANSTIDGFFNSRNIRPVWTLDGVGNLPTVTDYPDTVEWALFSEGTFTLLDGGTLDIGLVRDMELVSTNDYCMFTEQFMAVAKTGLDSLWVTQTLNVNGGSAGTLDVASVDY
jgi:hypothetical protein